MPNESTNGSIDHLRIRQEVSEFKALPPLSRAKLSTLACHTSSYVDTGDSPGLPSAPVSVSYKPFRPSSCIQKPFWQSDKDSDSGFRQLVLDACAATFKIWECEQAC